MHFKEVILIWLKWFHKKLARRYKEVVSLFFHYTLKSSKQKENPETNLNSASFYMKNSLQYFFSNVSI